MNNISQIQNYSRFRPNPAYATAFRNKTSRSLDIAETTGPLDNMRGKDVLVLADIENLSYGAKHQMGFKISYRTLIHQLTDVSRSCSAHAFFSRHAGGEDHWSRYFIERGWISHARDIEMIRTCRGVHKYANSDNHILFMAGLLVSRHSADVIAIASGDGTLVCDLTNAIKDLPKPRQIITLSLAGSTSLRLDASRNGKIAANIEIGRDCLRPLT
jgi:hypothetical protein